MSTSYTHLTTDEREMLLVFCSQDMGVNEMARRLNRSKSSISRELRRNRNEDGSYSAFDAEQKYCERRKRCVRKAKMDDPKRKAFVEEKLREYWSPEQIDGRMKLKQDARRVSYATIYRAIYSGKLEIPKQCLRRKRRKPSPHAEETRGRLHGHKTIHERPKAADTRSQYGHWEGDTVQGARGKGAAATFVDRRSGFLVAALMPDRKAKTLNQAMLQAFARFPSSLKRSFTMDHGNEFFSYAEIEKTLETKVYFADPYSSWQRGLNENTNGLLRQYFPKKCDFLKVTLQEFFAAVDALNNRPRKRLGFRTPNEVFPIYRLLHLT